MRRVRAEGPRLDTPAEVAYRHVRNFLAGVNPDLAAQFGATVEHYRKESQAQTFTAALAGLLAAAQPDRETPKGITKDRAARRAWDILAPHLSHGVALAAFDDGRVIVAAEDGRALRKALGAGT